MLIIIIPIDISYDIICDAPLIDPIIEYLFFDAHPPYITPYIVNVDNANINIILFGISIIIWNIIPLIPIIIILIITILAETNRTPFDLLEAESELVAGFLVEYSSILFVAYYLGEYTMILYWSMMISTIMIPSKISTVIIIYIIIWIRGALPRLRYDQLIKMGWSKILPITIITYIIIMTIEYVIN